MIDVLIYGLGLAVLFAACLWLILHVRSRSADVYLVDRPRLNRLFTKAQADEFQEDSDENAADLAREIRLSLLDDEREASDGVDQRGLPTWLKVGFPFGVVLVALAIYWFIWGDPYAVEVERVSRDFLDTESSERQDEIYALFETRADARTDDASAWLRLMQLQWVMGKYDELIITHTRAEDLGHVSNPSDQWYLLALANKQRSLDNDRTLKVLDRVVETGGELPLLIEMMVYRRAIDSGDFREAFLVSETVLTKPLPAEIRAMLETSRVTTLLPHLGSIGPMISVSVAVPEELVQQGWLTVLARAVQGGPPLAVARRPVIQGQTGAAYKVILADAMAMQPGYNLSIFDQVVVESRITLGSAVATEQALFKVTSDVVNPHQNPHINMEFRKDSEAQTDSSP